MTPLIRLTLGLLLLCIIPTWAQQQYTVETIPNQRLINDSRVSNPDSILSPGIVKEIDSLLIDLENRTTVQVAVVAVMSIGEADIFDFAQELFNTWGIGHKNNNGVLVLLVTDQRTIRIHTGGGVQGLLTDVTCKRIQRDYMVPLFKDGDYEAGMIKGLHRIHEVLIDPSGAKELVYIDERLELGQYDGWMIFLAIAYGIPFLWIWWGKRLSVNGFSDSKKPRKTQYEAMLLSQRAWVIEFGLIPTLIVLAYWPGSAVDATGLCLLTLYVYFIATLVHRLVRERRMLKQFIGQGRYYDATQYVTSTTRFWFFRALVFPMPFALYFLFHLTRKSHYRNHPRNCKICNTRMKKLSEREEDRYLDARQQFEEKIATVDYDVWLCPSCKATREWHYIKRKGKYERCPKCRTQAYYKKSRRTVVNATYDAAGEGKETFECKYCNEEVVATFVIPQLVRSSSSDGSSSDSSSSDSSSGSDWGGGSSDGGGASSSW